MNIYGYGEFSTEFEIEASGVSSQTAIPKVEADGLDVKISWVRPALNSSPLKSYKVFIRNSTGHFVEDTTVCDGSVTAIKN